jgi:hypothetical protein
MADAKSRALLAAGCLCCLALGACDRQGRDEMSWARAALARNERLEIVAADPQSRSFTVRIKDTGELRVLRADQLVGSPAPPASPGIASTEANTPAAPPGATPAGSHAEAASAETGTAWKGTAGEATETPAAPSLPPKVFASRALQPGSRAPPVPGQVLEAGPGYTIEAGSGPAPPAAPALREPGAGAPAVEVRHEPIVCQGARLLHIDNLNLQFEGDAVSAEDGCEIHITNSRIRATGVGVSARAANVHIDNSLIEGDTASIDAADGAQIYAASSRFKGLSRRLDTASVHDLGGNVWN